jgi:excisionase family DNA binding protein
MMAAMDDTDETVWDARDVARYLKVSRSWVYDQSDRGLIPYTRLGALRRYDPAVIKALLKKGDDKGED